MKNTIKCFFEVLFFGLLTISNVFGQQLIVENFDTGASRFTYQDNIFKGATQGAYANGV